MKPIQKYLACFTIALLSLTACNKENQDFFYSSELYPISISGFNGGAEQLIVTIDTFKFPSPLIPNSSFKQSNTFLFNGTQKRAQLKITENNTGKVVLEQELKKEDGKTSLSLLYFDGAITPMPEKPAVETDKISLIYMFLPTITKYAEPFDIVVGKYYATPQVFEELARAKSVKANEFCAPIKISTFSTARQEYNGVLTTVSFVVRICKAGTSVPYTDGTTYSWNALSTTAPKPSASAASSKLYIFNEAPAGTVMRFGTRLDN